MKFYLTVLTQYNIEISNNKKQNTASWWWSAIKVHRSSVNGRMFGWRLRLGSATLQHSAEPRPNFSNYSV